MKASMGQVWGLGLVLGTLASGMVTPQPTEDPCEIYCQGDLLHAVQLNSLFHDGKHFVDMPMKADPSVINAQFQDFTREWNITSDRLGSLTTAEIEALKLWVGERFGEPGSELVEAELHDWVEEPAMLAAIGNVSLRQFAKDVHAIWKVLGRTVDPIVAFEPQRHSIVYSDYTLVIPGGRFREIYYWDTYWVIKGLIASDMAFTATSVVENLLYYVETFGFVPNGGRVYYLTRSQPPFLSEMVRSVYEATGDVEWLKKAYPILEKEYKFWMDGDHAVNLTDHTGQVHTLNRFYSSLPTPRAESFKEDYETARKFFNETDMDNIGRILQNLRAGAESGYDYSSRWFRNLHDLSSISINEVVPIDLNSILYRMELNLGNWAVVAEQNTTEKYLNAASMRKEAIQALMWSAGEYQWRDLWISCQNATQCIPIVMSPIQALVNFGAPLWAGVHENTSTVNISLVVDAFHKSGFVLPGGNPVTLTPGTGQQWDFPNAWPPAVDMIIQGLRNTNVSEGTALAEATAKTWVETAFVAFSPGSEMANLFNGSFMYEKYNALELGKGGSGGEYTPQLGFGWSNGVVLDLLKTYGSNW